MCVCTAGCMYGQQEMRVWIEGCMCEDRWVCACVRVDSRSMHDDVECSLEEQRMLHGVVKIQTVSPLCNFPKHMLLSYYSKLFSVEFKVL